MGPNPSATKKTEPAKSRNISSLAQFSEKIGKITIIEKDTKSFDSKTSSASYGFHCSTCNASFTSSDAYLDHCNGRVHHKNLGLSLRVERVDEVDRVKARLQKLAHKRYMTENIIESKSTALIEMKLENAEIDLEKQKEERKRRKKSKKQTTAGETKTSFMHENEDEDKNEEELMSLMGFNSFA